MNKNFLRPLTFKEATHYGIDDLRRRQYDHIDFELRSWTSEMLIENQTNQDQNNTADSYNFQIPIIEQLVPQVAEELQDKYEFEIEKESRLLKVSVGDIKNITQDVNFIFIK